MQRFNRILNKIIMLDGRGCIEGSRTDLYIKRFIKIYSGSSRSKGLEEHCEEEITRGFAIAEPTYIMDTEQTTIERELVKV